MGLLDPMPENAGLAALMLTLYTGALFLSLSPLQEPLDLPSSEIYLVTGVPLLVYAGYQLGWGTTYQLWANITSVVALLSVLFVASPLILIPPYAGGIRLPAASYFLVTGAPFVVYVSFYCARRISRKRTQKRSANSP